MISKLFWIVPVASVTALLFAWIFFKLMMKSSEGTDRMKEIAQYVREGAMAYIKRQYKVVGIVFVFLVIFLTILAYIGVQNPFAIDQYNMRLKAFLPVGHNRIPNFNFLHQVGIELVFLDQFFRSRVFRFQLDSCGCPAAGAMTGFAPDCDRVVLGWVFGSISFDFVGTVAVDAVHAFFTMDIGQEKLV